MSLANFMAPKNSSSLSIFFLRLLLGLLLTLLGLSFTDLLKPFMDDVGESGYLMSLTITAYAPLAFATIISNGRSLFGIDENLQLQITYGIVIALGVFLAMGLGTRLIAALMLSITLFVMIFKFVIAQAMSHTPINIFTLLFYLTPDMIFALLYFLLFYYGPGTLALDHILWRNNRV
jgi:uncharacterized membrane protein YphA (DoxX/SURF4 family)